MTDKLHAKHSASEGAQGSTRYRMSDLEARTGVDREAIRFYIRGGLLPEPVKTARTQAWYSQRHVELIRLIRSLQEEHFLPLRAIKALLHDAPAYEFTPRQRQVFELIRMRLRHHSRAPAGKLTVQSLLLELGIGAADASKLRRLGALLSADEAAPEPGEAEILRQFTLLQRRGRRIGREFRVGDLDMVKNAVDLLFDQELRVFMQRLSDLPDGAAERLAEDFVPAVNRLFALLHEQKIRHFLERFRKNGTQPSAAHPRRRRAPRRR